MMVKTTILTFEYASIIMRYCTLLVLTLWTIFLGPACTDFASDWSPVHDAALHGRLLALKTLIDQGSSVNLLTLNKVSPLHEACVGGNAACAKLLIEKGAKVNSATVDWNTPLFNACVSGNVACVNLLLQHRAKPQAECHLSSPIHEAASRGANLNTEGDTPLHAAARASRPDLVQLLLDHGADVKARNTEGKEPLDLASPSSEARIIHMQRDGPPSLMQLCRLSVRKYLGAKQIPRNIQTADPNRAKKLSLVQIP